MATTTYKILGQQAPAVTTDVNLLTVAAATEAIASTLIIANTTATAATARVFARIAGAAAATTNAIYYDVSIGGNSSAAFTLGITLAATDVLTVRTSTANALTFTLFGTLVA